MSSLTPSEILLRRLRAHGKLARGVPARLVRTGRRRNPGQAPVLWRVVHSATADPLGIESVFTVKDLVAARSWRFSEAGTGAGSITYVEPAPQEGPDGSDQR